MAEKKLVPAKNGDDPIRFILTDESVNRYGFRVKTDGILLKNFIKNPIMLFNHDRWKYLPIGAWDDLKIENGKLTGVPMFDEDDEFSMTIKSKVEKGVFNTCSINFDIITLSDDPADLIKGQTRSTVVKSELLEASIVDIPGNANAIRLNFANNNISLSGDIDSTILNNYIPTIKNSPNPSDNEMKQIALSLGLNETATEKEIVEAINKLRKESVASLIQSGIDKGVITDANKSSYEKLALSDFDSVASLINSAPATEKKDTTIEEKREAKNATLATKLKGAGLEKEEAVDENDRKLWTLNDWRKKDAKGLQLMMETDETQYNKLVKEFQKNFNKK